MTLQISKIPRPFERSDQVQQAARETVLNTNRLTENKKDKTPTGVLVRSLRHSASLRSRVSPRLCCYVCLSASFAFLQGNSFLFPFVKAMSIWPKFPLLSRQGSREYDTREGRRRDSHKVDGLLLAYFAHSSPLAHQGTGYVSVRVCVCSFSYVRSRM